MHIVSVLFPWTWSKNRWGIATSSHCTEAKPTNIAIFRRRHLELELTKRWLINRALAPNFHPYNHPLDHSSTASHDSGFRFDLSPKEAGCNGNPGTFLQSVHIVVVLKKQWLIIFVLVCRTKAWITLTASDTQKRLGRKGSFSYIGSDAAVSGFAFVCFLKKIPRQQ